MSFKEIDIRSINFNPFVSIGDKWILITAGNEEKYNTMTASWGGMGVLWSKNVATIFIRPQRYTKEFVDNNDTFSISFLGDDYKKVLDICGAKSGRDIDKFKETGINAAFDQGTPFVEEAELVLVCKKLYSDTIKPEKFIDDQINKLYPNQDYHTMYIGSILKVLVKE